MVSPKKMLRLKDFSLFIHSITVLSASIPYPSHVDGSLAAISSASRNLVPPYGILALANNASLFAGNRLKVECESRRYGSNLKVKSCRDLFGYLGHDDKTFSFSERDSGIPHDIDLPQRTYSSELIRCRSRCNAVCTAQ